MKPIAYKGNTSKLKFLNIYYDINEPTQEMKDVQFNKFREEFYETMKENLDSPEFKKELLHCLQAGINLWHSLEDDTSERIYQHHIWYMNSKLDNCYNWFKSKEWSMYEK